MKFRLLPLSIALHYAIFKILNYEIQTFASKHRILISLCNFQDTVYLAMKFTLLLLAYDFNMQFSRYWFLKFTLPHCKWPQYAIYSFYDLALNLSADHEIEWITNLAMTFFFLNLNSIWEGRVGKFCNTHCCRLTCQPKWKLYIVA